MMTKCPSMRPILWNRSVPKGSNDDKCSLNVNIFVRQNWLQGVKWWPNVLQRDQLCKTELVAMGQMMTKCPSKWPILLNRSVPKGSNDDKCSLKVNIFVRQNWLQRVKWWPNVLQRDQLCKTELVAMGQMMTKCPSKWPILWNRSVPKGSNDDEMSLKVNKFVRQNWLERVKWWANVLQSDQFYEIEVFQKGQMMKNVLSKWTYLWDRIGCKGSNDDQMSFKETNIVKRNWLLLGQMMTKCPSKRPNLWDRSIRIGSNDDEISFKESKFVKQNWTHRVKWWPNVLQRDQLCETELVAMGQMMTTCPSKRPNLWDRSIRIGSNDDEISFKESKFVKQNWTHRVKWWPNVLQRDQLCETELVAMGQMMTKCPSKWPILWNRSVPKGSNDDEMSLKVNKFVRQNWLERVKWWANVLQSDQFYEIEVFQKGQMMKNVLSKWTYLWDRIGCKGSNDDQMSFKETNFVKRNWLLLGQMMTKCPSKRPNLWDRSICIGSNDDEISFKESKFVKQNWTHRVKWWPNVLQRDQLCETELVAMGQMMTTCPSKRPNLWDRSIRIGSNDDEISFKESKFVKQNWTHRVKWWPNVLQRDQLCETELVAMGQMMTKCPSKWPILWNRSVPKGSNDDEMSLKVNKFVRQNWLERVKWWANVLQSDQFYETEVFTKDEMDGQVPRCPSGTGALGGGQYSALLVSKCN